MSDEHSIKLPPGSVSMNSKLVGDVDDLAIGTSHRTHDLIPPSRMSEYIDGFVQLPWGGYYTKLAGDKDEDLLGVDDSNILSESGNLDFAALARQQKYSMLQYREENGNLVFQEVFQEDDRKCHLCNNPIMVVDHAKKEAYDNFLFERQVYTHGSVIKQCFCEDCVEKEVYLGDGAWFPDLAEMYLCGGGHVETADSHEYNLRFLWFGDPPF